jgi:integrase
MMYDRGKGKMVHGRLWPADMRDIQEFVKLHLEFVNNFSPAVYKNQSEPKPGYLIDCLGYYHDYLSDEEGMVQSYEKKNLSEKYLNGQFTNLKTMVCALKEAGIDMQYFPVFHFNEGHVSIIHDYLTSNYSNKTYNDKIATYKALFAFLEQKKVVAENYFKDIKKKSTKARKVIVPLSVYQKLRVQTSPENGQKFENKGKGRVGRKQLYREWLVDVWDLYLWTGCRPEEIENIRLSDVFHNHIKVHNYKVERGKKSISEIRMIPLIHELKELVDRLIEQSGISGDDFLASWNPTEDR